MKSCLRILILILLVLAGQIARADVQWRVMRTRHFIIYYSAEDDSTARKAGVTAEKWQGILSRKMKFDPGGVTPIYLYPDRRSFAEDTGYDPASGIVGMAHTRTYKVRIDATGVYTDVSHIIPHELVHVFVSHRLRGFASRLPLWMHEGLAKYWGEDWSGPDAELLADSAASGQITPLEKLTNAFPETNQGRSVAYVESYSAVRYMAEKYTPQSLLDVLDELRKNETFDVALFNSIGEEPAKFGQEWEDFLWDKYGLMRWMKVLSAIVSAGMAILAVFAFRARLSAKHEKELEFDEDEDSPADDEL